MQYRLCLYISQEGDSMCPPDAAVSIDWYGWLVLVISCAIYFQEILPLSVSLTTQKKIIRLCLPLFDGVCYFSEMRSSCLIDLVRLRSGCTLVKKNQDTISEKWWNKNDESIESVCLVFVFWVKVDGFHSSSEWTQRWRMCADQESITGTQFDWAELRKRRGLERNRKLGLSL